MLYIKYSYPEKIMEKLVLDSPNFFEDEQQRNSPIQSSQLQWSIPFLILEQMCYFLN